MDEKTISLFCDEESTIARGENLVSNAGERVPVEAYADLLDGYKKLYRQSKRLVKMGDRMQGELENMARQDCLTRIYNRRYFLELGGREVARASRNGYPLSLVGFDVDHFKRVNDSYGHEAGDIVLMRLAALVRDRVRETDIFGRMGGEEFAILMPDTGLDGARHLAENLREMIASDRITHKNILLSCTASFGIACHTDENDSLDALLRLADCSMYKAKSMGRNRVCW